MLILTVLHTCTSEHIYFLTKVFDKNLLASVASGFESGKIQA